MRVHTGRSKTPMGRHTSIEVIEMIIVYVAVASSEDENRGVNGCSTVCPAWWWFFPSGTRMRPL